MNPGVRSDVAIMTHTPLRLGEKKREPAADVTDYTSHTKQPQDTFTLIKCLIVPTL